MPRITPDDLDRIAETVRNRQAIKEGGPRACITVHMGICGISAGADRVFETITAALAESGADDIRLTTSGCAGFCSREPMMTVELRGNAPVKYALLDADKARRIFDEHVINGRVVPDVALCRGSELEA